VHRALESWDFRDERALRTHAAAAIRSTVAREGGGPVEAKGRLAAVEREVAAILDGLLGSPLPGRLAAVTILGREVPILHRAPDGATWGGACDLVYRDARGLVVADYKTDRLEDAAGTHARLAATYADQMAVYLAAVAATHPGETVRGELLMLRTGTVIELPARNS
jgi:ATP-dependent exoDNAse (exonuclease V) beta subunit